MTILVKKVFISSKPTFVYLLCPPLCGPFSIQESAAGGLSYKEKRGYPYWISSKSEHETGFEPATLALARRYSTTEPLVHNIPSKPHIEIHLHRFINQPDLPG